MNTHLCELISHLPPDSLTVIHSNDLVLRNGDVHYPFRQGSDFLYLTGLSVPGLVLSIQTPPHPLTPSPSEKGDDTGTPSPKGEGRGEVILWREPIGEKDIIWGSDKLSDTELEKISGITDIRDIADMEEYISKVTPCSVIAKTPLRKALEAPLGCEAILSQEKENKIASQARNDETIETNKSWQSIIHEMRMIKTAEEIVKIRNCIQITESIYQAVLEQVQPGMYEYEIEAMIAYGFRRHHGIEAFPTIVASGINSCTLHYTANTRRIEAGDIVLLDFGIELDGYGADISRTFAVGGFSPPQQRIYDAVLEVRDFAERELIPGITRRAWATRVKEYMYTVCKKLQLEDIDKHTAITNPYFPHSIGHFLGLDTHDVGDSDMPLAPGMILTIEPGLYMASEAIGIRIEDDYLVTETGCERLR